MSKSINKNISKNLSGKYNYKLLNHGKQSATDALNPISLFFFGGGGGGGGGGNYPPPGEIESLKNWCEPKVRSTC